MRRETGGGEGGYMQDGLRSDGGEASMLAISLACCTLGGGQIRETLFVCGHESVFLSVDKPVKTLTW